MADPFDELLAANPAPKAAPAAARPAPTDPFEALLAANPKPGETTDAPTAGLPGDASAAVGRGIIDGVPIVGPYLLAGVNRAAAGIRSLKNDTKFSDELRNVEARQAMTPEARRASPPWSTQDVPDAQQWIAQNFGDGVTGDAAALHRSEPERPNWSILEEIAATHAARGSGT